MMLLRPQAQAELAQIFTDRLAVGADATESLRGAWRWVSEDWLSGLGGVLVVSLQRADIPEAIRFSGLRTMANGWCRTRRLQQQTGECLLGRVAEGEASLVHDVFCDSDRSSGRGLGAPVDRGFHLAHHFDAVLMAHCWT